LGEVHVNVGQARGDGPTSQVDGLRAATGQAAQLGSRADRHDAIAADRHRLGHRAIAVHREHLAVDQQQIGSQSVVYRHVVPC
jgi:hypothetical protein